MIPKVSNTISAHSDEHYVTAALKAGASGYVLKASINNDFIPALRTVMANKLFLSSQIKDIVIQDYTKPPTKANDSYLE